ncbi:unnamed protein product [Absidia cylindrospora]
MHLLSIKKSTLSLKQSFIRQTHRFSSSSSPSPKKNDQQQHQEQQQPSARISRSTKSTSSHRSQHYFDIAVIETTSTFTIIDNKEKQQQKTLTLFNIIVEDDNRHISLVRFVTDVTELDQLFKKYFAKKKTNGEKLETWLRSCATHPVLGKSSLLRDFLSPQRQEDIIITKEAIHSLVQQQALHYENSTTIPSIAKSQQQQQRPPSLAPLQSLSTIDESILSTPTDLANQHHYQDNLSLLSSCLDSSVISSRLDIANGINDSDNDDGDDLIRLTSLLPLPPADPNTLVGSTTDIKPLTSDKQLASHPFLVSPSKLTSDPPLGQERYRDSINKPILTMTKDSSTMAKQKKQPTRMTLDDLQFLKVLGKGCMGKVILVRHHQSARLYALKAISKEWVITQREIEHAVMERNILSKVSKAQHPFLIKLHHSFQNANQLFLVMDYHVGSDLATQLQLHYCFDADRCRFYIAEILLGLQELHRLGILYRDLKPENILLAADGHIVLTDFGFSRLFDEDEENQQSSSMDSPLDTRRLPYHTRTFCGTVEYMAIEIFLSEEYTYAVDYWSLGIILYEMLLGYTPFGTDNDAELYRRVMEDPIDIPQDMPPATADLILGLLERNPEDRLGCAQFFDVQSDGDAYDSVMDYEDILQHPYFYHLDWSDVYNKRLPAPFVPRLKSETDVSHFDPDFVKLSPRLSTTHHPDGYPYDDDDMDDDLDDDPYGLDPEAVDSNTWANRYNNNNNIVNGDDQVPLDQAFVGYSYINENTCVDTDSLLDEDYYQQDQEHIKDNNSAPLAPMMMDSTKELEGNDRASHYYGTTSWPSISCTASASALSPSSSSSPLYHHDVITPGQFLASSSSARPGSATYDKSNIHCGFGNASLSASQQLGFSRFQRRHDQHQTRLSSSFTLASLQSDSDDVVWLK